MTSRCHLPLLAALTLSSPAVDAQQDETPAAPASTASAPAAPALQKLRKQSLRPGGEAYPVALADQGVQGTAEVLVKISAEGHVADASLYATSRSAALDELALAYARALRFRAPANAASAPLPSVIVPVEFLRDSTDQLHTKTCAQFNVDVAYFKATFPETDPRRMTVINLTTGLLLVGSMARQVGSDTVTQARKLNAAGNGVVVGCAAAPQENFLKLFVELAKQAG